MIASVAVELDAQETGGSLFDKLQDAGARLCVETMNPLKMVQQCIHHRIMRLQRIPNDSEVIGKD